MRVRGILNLCRRTICLTAMILLPFAGSQALAADARPAGEYDIKAAYLYNFTKFVEWPQEASGRDAFVICVLGKNPFGDALDELAGKPVKQRRIVVRHIFNADEAQGCDLLFLSASEKVHQKSILASLTPANGMLTVSDVNQFSANGGMIGLVTQGGKIRFEINNRTAMQANLRISSHLLRLAVKVLE